MRYTIGCTIIKKVSNEKKIGFFSLSGILGLGTLLNMKNIDDAPSNYKLLVFDDIKSVQTYCQILSRSYRRDDVWANSSIKSKQIIKFYPLKIDSLKFPFELNIVGEKPFYEDRFKNRHNEVQGRYFIADITKLKDGSLK